MALVESLAAGVEIFSSARHIVTAGRRYLHVEPELFKLDDILGLTPSDVADIRAFLSSPGVRELFTLIATVLICEPGAKLDQPSNGVFLQSFRGLAEEWRSEREPGWAKDPDVLYRHAISQLERLVPRAASLEEYDDATSSYLQFVNAPLFAAAQSSFKRSILSLAGDLERLAGAGALARRIAMASNGCSLPLFSHLSIDRQVDRTSLYVDRHVSFANSESLIKSQEIFSSRGYRAVLVGNPGAGKSTLVEHLRRQDDSQAAWAEGTLVLTCRDYAANRWDGSIADALFHVMRADLQVDVSSHSVLVDALLLGRIKVILDGLDEVIDKLQRSELVQRIERFCSTYPLVSVLVTSREVGYDQAPLNRDMFALMKLQDFTWAQVHEYARKWFSATGTPHLTPSFMLEVEGVMDIAVNPLLLSLLCSLYKADGQIPSNRYDVYNRCADLLFVRWDQHRQIRHPSAVNYGMRLMEYIGSQFFTHQSAQSGLDEKQLAQLLATYLRDAFGSADPEGAALDFLDFCAERAWLLVVLAHEPRRGLRIFGFTHRTFYEYFSAKSIARSGASPQGIADTALREYQKDTASFIPELLVQAADSTREGGGAAVFGEVVRRQAAPALLLRLMNAPLTSRVREQAFVCMMQEWNRSDVTGADFSAMAQLNLDAREQLRTHLMAATPRDGLSQLVEAWSEAVLEGGSPSIQKQWLQQMFLALMEERAAVLLDQDPNNENPNDQVRPIGSPCTHQLLVALQYVEPSIVPIERYFSAPAPWSEGRVGGIQCLLRTDDEWLRSLTDSGLASIRERLLSLRGITPFTRAKLRDGMRDIEQGVNSRLWSQNQLALAVILLMMGKELKAVALPRLEGQLIRTGLLVERANGSVAWQRNQLEAGGLAEMWGHRLFSRR